MKENRIWQNTLYLLAFFVFIAFVGLTWSVLIPFLLGLVIAYLVDPLIDLFVARGWRRDRVVLVLFFFILSFGAVLIFYFFPHLYKEVDFAIKQIPTYANSIDSLINEINSELRQRLTRFIGHRADQISISFHADKFFENLLVKLPANLLNVAHMGVWVLIIPFSCFFGLKDGQQWIDILFELTPSRYVESLLGLLEEINATLGGYIRGLLFESACVGILTMIGLFALGLDGAVLLGVITGLLNFVPFLAVIVGGLISVLAGYFQHIPNAYLMGIIFLFLGIRLVDDFVLIPFILGHSVSLHPLVMVFAVLAGMKLGGFLGLVFAIPAAAVVKVILTILFLERRLDDPITNQDVIS